jgi:TolA-binding protein
VRTRWHFPCSARQALRDLLEGDLVFFDNEDGGGDDGGGDADDAQGGDEGDQSREDDADDSGSGGDDDDQPNANADEEAARKARREARNLRERLKKAESRVAELEKKDETEQQRRERELEEQKTKVSSLEERSRRLSVQVAAAKVGIRPKAAEAAAALVDWQEIDQDDDEAVETALKALKKEHDYLWPPTDVDAGARDRSNGGGDEGEVTPGIGRLRRAYAEK